MDASDQATTQFAQILALAPMVLPALGVPKPKIDLVLAALQEPNIMINNQPNIARLMQLKGDLENVDQMAALEPITGRLICASCAYCNTFEIKGQSSHG